MASLPPHPTADDPQRGVRAVQLVTIRTSELIGALSAALDLTEGLLPGHAVRTCYLTMRLAERIGMPDPDREALFYAALLKDSGCSSNAAAITQLFGTDDQALKAVQASSGRSTLAMAAMSIREMTRSADPLPQRIRRLVHLAVSGRKEQRSIEQIRCERGAQIALKAGFDPAVSNAITALHEHWDGKGLPAGLRGHEIPLYSRLVAVCAGLDVFNSARGERYARRVVNQRRGAWYDPDLADHLLQLCEDGLLRELGQPNLVRRLGDLEPDRLMRISDEEDVDRIASSFADVIDAKSPFTGRHSQRVAEIASDLALRLGMPADTARDVRRAGLLHDLGKLGVPNLILDKPGKLTPDEFAQIRRHPELTLRILQPLPLFHSVADMAACHHERLDGHGYFRGLAGDALSLGARIVAVADVYEALTANRPYRAAMSPEEALALMRRDAGDHLASEAIEGLASSHEGAWPDADLAFS